MSTSLRLLCSSPASLSGWWEPGAGRNQCGAYLKCDGILPTIIDQNKKFADLTPEHVRQIKAFVEDNRQIRFSTLISLLRALLPGMTPRPRWRKCAPGLKPALPGGLNRCGLKKSLKNGISVFVKGPQNNNRGVISAVLPPILHP